MSLLPLRCNVRAPIVSKALLTIACGLLLSAFALDVAAAAKRVALVIGNSAYRSVSELPNPSRDATAIGAMFKGAGFDVVETRVDLGYLEFTRALRRFEDAAKGSDIAVIFYAGHGIEIGGKNYLVPIDAKLASDRDAQDEAVLLDRLMQSAEPAQALRLIILDACRDNPFNRNMKRHGATRGILTRGLGKVELTGSNTLIAYASKAGSTAEDGDGEHSPFTFALLKNLVVPGLDIRLAFGRVRDDVLKHTDNRQEPFVYGSLGGANISLVPLPASAPEPALSDVRGDYNLVERIGTRKAWEVFLATHKTGIYADLARAQLAKLEEREGKVQPASASSAAKPVVASEPPRPVPPAKPAAKPEPKTASAPVAAREKPPAGAAPKPKAETTVAALEPQSQPKSVPAVSEDAKAWERIKDSSDPKAFRDFIDRYPQSVLALTAQRHLLALEEAALQRQKQTASRPEPAKPAAPPQPVAQPHAAAPPQPAVPSQPAAPLQPAANTPELVASAQKELERIGCYEGAANGNFSPSTRAAVKRYLSLRGRTGDDAVTGDLVADLKKEKSRVCPLQCAADEVVKGDRCVVEATPSRQEASRDRKRQEQRNEKRTKSSAKARPRQEARRQGGGGGGHTIGVGF